MNYYTRVLQKENVTLRRYLDDRQKTINDYAELATRLFEENKKLKEELIANGSHKSS